MKLIKLLFLSILFTSFSYAQVGIGTTNPDTSAMLDIKSDSQGLLAPRMDTADRNAIASPAEGLLVFDTDEDAFYYYDTTGSTWVKLQANNVERDNYKLVKSVADLAPELTAGGGSKYLLQTNTLYEINGSITLAYPIELNNAQLSGRDAGEDKLSRGLGGTVFTGSTGGNVKNLTITGGGTVFAITGGTTLLFQNCIVEGMASVGTISGVGLYFSNIINFVDNDNGITYTDIPNLLLNNQGWLGNNRGTFETLTGTFGLVEKVSGFSSVNGDAVGFDVSNNPVVSNGVISGTVFSGTLSAAGAFVKRYTLGSYTGYNFTNDWTVNAPGISSESDDEATANIYFSSSTATAINNNTPRKLPVTTTPTRQFRATNGGASNRIEYAGSKTRNFVVNAALSYTATGGSQFRFSIYKNGSPVPGANVLVNTLVTNQNQSVAILGTVDLAPTDFVEVWVEKTSANNESFLTQSFSLLIN